MSDFIKDTLFSPGALLSEDIRQDIRYMDAANAGMVWQSGGGNCTWRTITMEDIGMSEHRCGYCNSRHHDTNCPNCGAPQ